MTEPFAALEVMQLAGQYDLHQSHIRNEGLSKATDVKNKIVELKVLLERLRVAAKELEENNSTSLPLGSAFLIGFESQAVSGVISGGLTTFSLRFRLLPG